MKRLIALCLALCLILVSFAACGKGETDGRSAVSQASSAETAPVQETQTGQNPAQEEPSTPETSAVETIEEEVLPTISYPLENPDDVTLTTWNTMKGTYTAAFGEWNECYILEHAKEATGIGLSVTSVSDQVAADQYSLMVASGDYPDFIPMNYYNGGTIQAYTDEVIIEITEEQMKEYAPDYYTRRQNADESTQEAAKVNGMNLSIYNIMDEPLVGAGLVIRQDWLDQVDMDTPTTLDEFTDVLYAFQEKLGADEALRLYQDFSLEQFNAAFDTRCVGYSNSSLPVYVNNGIVTCSLVEDNYKEFVAWIAKLYADGVIHKDFYTMGNGGPDRFGDVVANRCGLWSDNAGTVNDWTRWADDPNQLDAEALANPVGADGKNTWGDELIGIGDGMSYSGWSITATSEYPELVLQYFNYFFTEEGSYLGNYGVEGIGYEKTADGTVTLLDAITNSEYGINPGGAISINSMLNLVPHYQYEKRLFSTLDEDALEAYEIYNDPGITAEHFYPNGAALTTEESDQISGTVSSILTYAGEQMLSYMTGAAELTDESWDSFQATLEDMGIEEVLEVYQNAYEAYQSEKD